MRLFLIPLEQSCHLQSLMESFEFINAGMRYDLNLGKGVVKYNLTILYILLYINTTFATYQLVCWIYLVNVTFAIFNILLSLKPFCGPIIFKSRLLLQIIYKRNCHRVKQIKEVGFLKEQAEGNCVEVVLKCACLKLSEVLKCLICFLIFYKMLLYFEIYIKPQGSERLQELLHMHQK